MGVITLPPSGMQQQAATAGGPPRFEVVKNLRLTLDGELARCPGWKSGTSTAQVFAVAPDRTVLSLLTDYASPKVATAKSASRYGSLSTKDFVDLNGPAAFVSGNPVPVCKVGPVTMATTSQRCWDYHDSQGFSARAYGSLGNVWEVCLPSLSGVGTVTLYKDGVSLGSLGSFTLYSGLCIALSRDESKVMVGFSSSSSGGQVFKIYNATTGALIGSCTPTTTNRASFLDCAYDMTYDYWVCSYVGANPEQAVALEAYAPTGGAATGSTGVSGGYRIGLIAGHRAYLCQTHRLVALTSKEYTTVSTRGALVPVCVPYSCNSSGVLGVSSAIIPLSYSGEGLCVTGRPVVQGGDATKPWVPVASVATAVRFDSVLRLGTEAGPVGRWNEGFSGTHQSRNARLVFNGQTLKVYSQRTQFPIAPRWAHSPHLGIELIRAYSVDVDLSPVTQSESGGAVAGGVPTVISDGQTTTGYPCPYSYGMVTATTGGSISAGTWQVVLVEEVQTPKGILRGPVSDIGSFTVTGGTNTLTLTCQSGRPFGTRGAYGELFLYTSFNGEPLRKYGAVDLTNPLTLTYIAALPTAPYLYSTGGSSAVGGVTPNYQAPSCTDIWTGSDRIAVAGLTDYPRDVMFSKLLTAGEFPSFATSSRGEWHVTLPDAVVAVAQLQNCWVAWTSSAVYAIFGEGPDDTGLSGTWDTPRVCARVGCYGPQSVTTDGQNVYWQSPGGDIWQMGTDLQPTNIGEAVSHYLQSRAEVAVVAAQWVTGASYNASTGLVMFLLGDSLVLTFSPRSGAWAEEQVPSSGMTGCWNLNNALTAAECTVLTGGTTWQTECTDPMDTPSATYPMVVETNDMGAFGPGQTGRFKQVAAMFSRPITCMSRAGDPGTGPATIAFEAWYDGSRQSAYQSESMVPEGSDVVWSDLTTILPGESGVVDLAPSRASARSMRVRFTWSATLLAFSQLSLEGDAFGHNQRTGAASR